MEYEQLAIYLKVKGKTKKYNDFKYIQTKNILVTFEFTCSWPFAHYTHTVLERLNNFIIYLNNK